jgi:Protein of unknown function (DUF3300)
MPGADSAAKQAVIPPDQLDALVAPIALYPDNLLAQVMVASTYPLEIVQLHQWLQKNKDIQKDQKKLTEKVAKQPWDPSIQAMAPLPDVVKWLADDVQWTTDLGNAFLAQQKDVMAAVQRMRQKAQAKGALKSTEQVTVQTQTVESQSVIVIQQSNPQVIYVPSYDPVYVYGPPVYPYPPIYYPPYYSTGAVVAAGAVAFGVGVAMGAAWGGGWGWGCGWGGGDVDINVNNNFNRNTNIQGGNRTNIQGGNRVNAGNNKWQHNPTHRGGAPYGDRGTANKFGGTTRGDSLSNRQQGAQRQLGQQGGVSNRGGTGVSDRGNAPGAGNRSGAGGNTGVSNRGGTGVSDRGSFGGSSDRMGNRSAPSSSNRSSGGFGSGSSNWGGSNTRSSSSRGSSSMSSSRGSWGGGGGSRGGGMSRGGGGGRRR